LSKSGKGEKSKNAKNNKDIRVIKPLYSEEIHILVRRDSSIKSFFDLKDKKIFAGKPKSGSLMTITFLHKKLFGTKLKNYKIALPKKSDKKGNLFNRALKKLSHREIDAIIQVGGQPIKNLNKYMGAKAYKKIHFLPYMNNDTLSSYFHKGKIHAKSYHWLKKDIPTLATTAFLVTFNFRYKKTNNMITKFIKSLNKNLPKLKKLSSERDDTPHLKWREVTDFCNLPSLPDGLNYHFAVNKFCNIIDQKHSTKNTSKKIIRCTDDDKIIMKLCEEEDSSFFISPSSIFSF